MKCFWPALDIKRVLITWICFISLRKKTRYPTEYTVSMQDVYNNSVFAKNVKLYLDPENV